MDDVAGQVLAPWSARMCRVHVPLEDCVIPLVSKPPEAPPRAGGVGVLSG